VKGRLSPTTGWYVIFRRGHGWAAFCYPGDAGLIGRRRYFGRAGPAELP
jgi:hypothetical protein